MMKTPLNNEQTVRMRIVASAVKHGCPPIDIPIDELEGEFGQCPTRILKVDLFGGYYEQDIFYKGRWRKVGMTDLYDDVATGLCAGTVEEALTLEKMVPKAYGARVHPDYISIITHMSDG